MNILHIIANPKPIAESASKKVSDAFFTHLKELNTTIDVTDVDLYQNPPPFYSVDAFHGFWGPVANPAYTPSADEGKAMVYAKQQAELFNNADVLVITTPMWNFSAPAILKAWVDQVLAPNLTFTISADGVEPKHNIGQVIVLAASGGVYKENDERDALLPFIRAAFGFVGIENVVSAWADGQNGFFFKDSADRLAAAIEAAQELAEDILDEGAEE